MFHFAWIRFFRKSSTDLVVFKYYLCLLLAAFLDICLRLVSGSFLVVRSLSKRFSKFSWQLFSMLKPLQNSASSRLGALKLPFLI